MRRHGMPRPELRVVLAGLCLLLARDSLAGGETVPLPEGSIARLGRGEIWVKSALSADGKRLAAGSRYGVWLRDGETGAEVARMEGGADGIRRSLAFSPDASILAGGGADGSVRFWDVESGRYRDAPEKHRGRVLAMAFSPDGATLATTGGEDKRIRLWSVDSARPLATLGGHLWDVVSVAFSPDGTSLASGSGDGTVRLWSVEDGLHTATLPGHGDWVYSVAFSPDGSLLASGARDGEVRLWDVASGRHKVTLPHRSLVYYLAFSPDGATLATLASGGGGEVRLWDVASGQPGASLPMEGWGILSLTFAPDGNVLVSSGSGYTVRRRDMAGQLQASLSFGEEHMRYVASVAFSPDGKSLASAGADNAVRLWDVDGRRFRAILHGHRRPVSTVAFSPDGSLLASGSVDLTVRLWDPGSGRHTATLPGPSGQVTSVAFSPDGLTLASGDGHGTILLRRVEDGRLEATLEAWPKVVRALAFSPDGRTLASGHDDGIRLWDTATGELRDLREETGGSVDAVAYSPDGRTLAGGGWDGLLRLWDTGTGELRAVLEGHGEPGHGGIREVSFSPDGALLVSTGGAQAIRLWAAESGRPKGLFMYNAIALAFSPEGTTLATGNRDGTILLWDLSPHIAGPTSVGLPPAQPDRTALQASYPNPFNLETWIPFQLQAPARVRLTIHDVRGARVREIDLGYRPAGWYRTSGRAARWDGRDQRGETLASGVYFARLQAGAIVQMRKMLLLK